MKPWMVTYYGGGEKLRLKVEANSRQEAIDTASQEAPSWHVTKITARPARAGEQDDRTALEYGQKVRK